MVKYKHEVQLSVFHSSFRCLYDDEAINTSASVRLELPTPQWGCRTSKC